MESSETKEENTGAEIKMKSEACLNDSEMQKLLSVFGAEQEFGQSRSEHESKPLLTRQAQIEIFSCVFFWI